MSLATPFASTRPTTAVATPWVVWTPAFAALVAFAVVLFSPNALGDGDTWWHLKAGDWILAHAAVPRVDPFSFTMAGAPWTAHEWLSEALLALAFRAAGWSGVLLLTAIAAAAAMLIFVRRLARDLDGVALFVVALLGANLLSASLLARPHILALPILAAWGAGLLAARDADRPPSLFLLPLMALWANLHGGFAFGLALIAPFAVEALLAAPPGGRAAVARGWILFGGLAVAAALLTPHCVEGLLFPVRLLGMTSLANVGEWQATSFAHFGPLEMALLALLTLALWRPVRAPIIRLVLLIVFVHLSLQHARHQMLLGILAPMLLAAPIARAIGAPAPAVDRGRVGGPAILSALALALALAGFRIAWPVAREDGASAPIAAVEAVPAALREKPVLNGYDFGGYLIWSGVRPFIDGRTDMYGDGFMNLYRRLTAPDPAALDGLLARDAIAWTIFPPDRPVVALMDAKPGWRRLYADAYAVVHVRVEPSNPPALRGGQGD